MIRKARLRPISEKRQAKLGKVYSSLSPGRKPLKKSNPAKQAKRRKQQAAKHRGYMRSATRKQVEARSGGRCEGWWRPYSGIFVVREPPLEFGHDVVCYADSQGTWARCEREATVHHHKTYARYGGKELPEDMLHVCVVCHDAIERQKPAGNRFTRSRKS